MQAAVAALVTFALDETLLEPDGWNRSTNGAHSRRRPNLDPDEEFVAP
jgi:hypothetical protein